MTSLAILDTLKAVARRSMIYDLSPKGPYDVPYPPLPPNLGTLFGGSLQEHRPESSELDLKAPKQNTRPPQLLCLLISLYSTTSPDYIQQTLYR